MAGTDWLVVTLVTVLSLHTGYGLTCLNCDAVANPRLCTHVTKCFQGEKCGMETFINSDGDVQYKLGCVDTNTCDSATTRAPGSGNVFFSCHSCCNDQDLCNVRGCNATGFPVNRGPICYNCESFPEGIPCHRISHCETHEVCYNEAHLLFQADVIYSSGCRSKHQCADQNFDSIIGIGKRTTSICTDCCEGDLCNLQCKDSHACSDDATCQLLMTNFDVCKSPDLAKQFCQKSCGLCPNAGSATSCRDTRLDCAYIHSIVNMCGSQQDASNYGCMHYCGYCQGSNTGGQGMVSAVTSIGLMQSSTTATITTVHTGAAQTISGGMPLLYDGDKVIRGPDWNWGNQDGNGVGTVIDSHVVPGWIQVFWSNTNSTQSYRYGAEGKYEIQLYARPTTGPTTTTTNRPIIFGTLQIGDKVVRGPDWSWQDQDGGSTGTVTVAPSGGWVIVRWDKTGIENSYRYDPASNRYDVMLYQSGSTTTIITSTKSTTTMIPTAPTVPTAPAGPTAPIGPTAPTAPTAPIMYTSTTTIPVGTTTPRPLYVGDRVVRGPDWVWQDQDGNSFGTVTGASGGGWVTVYWNSTGKENAYRYGEYGNYDIKYYPVPGGMTTASTSTSTTMGFNQLHDGDKVVRGPDWIWGDQDQNGLGTVSGGGSLNGWVTVTWDAGGISNTYRYGDSGKYDVQKAGNNPTTTQTAPASTTQRTLILGDVVVRGPDWRWQDQDGNGTGIVTGLPQPGWVLVRWTNSGVENTYRYGLAGTQDVVPAPLTTTPHDPFSFLVGDSVVRGPDWQWGDQDSNGKGTVVGVDQVGWVTVRWDNNITNAYRNGFQSMHDIQKLGGSITTKVLPLSTSVPPTYGPGLAKDMYVGARVERGLDWHYGTQDGYGYGTVRALPPQVEAGWVQVEWDNGYTNNYRLGAENAYDVLIVPGTYNPPSAG